MTEYIYNVKLTRAQVQVVDPWAGSYFMETLTNDLYHSALSIIQEV